MTAVYDPTRTAFIQRSLWRGNLPLRADKTFAETEIRESLGIGPETMLIDVSLIDNVEGSERGDWSAELKAFDVDVDAEFPTNRPDIPPQFNQEEPHFDPGHVFDDPDSKRGVMWWQIEGGSDGIVLGPATRSYNFIGLIERLGQLDEINQLRNEFPTVGIPHVQVYVHCMNGTDRTGAVVAAYGLRWMGLKLDEAFRLADSVKAAGTMNLDYQKLVKAYHQWLEENAP